MPAARRQSSLIPVLITASVVAALLLLLWKRAPRPPTVTPPVPPPPATTLPPSPPTQPDTVILTPDVRAIPGAVATRTVRYRHPTARKVAISGAWDYWANPQPMVKREGVWEFDVAALKLAMGRYEFKLIPDGKWEPGDNRVLYVNPDGWLERPPDIITSALLNAPNRIDVLFRRDVARSPDLRVRLVPEVPVARVNWVAPSSVHRTAGYAVAGEFVTFTLDEQVYGLALKPHERVAVAGSFNSWRADGGQGQWALHDADDDGTWTTTVRLGELAAGNAREDPVFKFVVNGQQWLPPPAAAPNAAADGKGNVNLRIDPQLSRAATLEIHTAEPLALSNHTMVVLEGLVDRPAVRELSPGALLDRVHYTGPLGPELGRGGAATTFRLFAPRAITVTLERFSGPRYAGEDGVALAPRDAWPMQLGDAGVWSAAVPDARAGDYYMYQVHGPPGAGEGFNPRARVADPYARAMAHGDYNALVIDPDATNAWFRGWTDTAHRPPAVSEVVIYETHVRDLTSHASSGVPEALRGKYAGVLATTGLGTGLDHLKRLGVNAIELMPTAEFANGTNRYDWGYGPAFYFAPEASFARDPLRGSQYYEFKHLVNELHARGFAVILDVVYNHIGSPNVFQLLDRKYYFRQDADYNFSSFSGCGNDVRSEAPMMRRLIIDNILYWMREHHVDGFRLDLAELVDMQTLLALRDAARAENPNVILISEPWSFRGDHRQKLRGTGWSAWNGDFRYVLRRFVRGEGNREDLKGQIRGCVDAWAATPAQAINYLESHDDKTFADEITGDPRGDGRNSSELDAARNRLAATALFTALGTPMLSEGQEWLRSKRGLHNTFDRGDEVNGLNWQERERPLAAATLEYYRDLVLLRRSAAGATLRWAQAVPDDYIQWVMPSDGRALGYIMNGARRHPGAGIVVLLNAADRPTEFQVPFPAGNWKLVGDGRRLDARGLPAPPTPARPDGTRSVTVPAMSAWIYLGQ